MRAITTSSRRTARTTATLVATAVLLAACGGTSSPPETAPPAAPEVDESESSADAPYDGPTTTVWFDGWSIRTMDGAALRASALDASGGSVGEADLTLEPADLADLEQLLADDPDAVARLMARMVRYDPLLDCTVQGCTSQRGDVPLDWLADPSTTPAFAPAYVGWGVTAGAWTAEVPAPAGAATITVEGDGWSATEFDLGGGASTPVLGAAFGHLFPLRPFWIEDPEGRIADLPMTVATVGSIDALETYDAAAFLQGLAHPVPEARSLDPTQFVVFSSITLGCLIALCVPDEVFPMTFTTARFTGVVCSKPEFSQRVSDPSHQFGAVVVSQILEMPLEHPTHQWLFWGDIGARPELLEGHVEGGVGLFTGDPPLTDRVIGPMRIAHVFTGPGTTLRNVVGRVNFPPDADQPISEEDWVDVIQTAERC